jgi:archaemetzincin
VLALAPVGPVPEAVLSAMESALSAAFALPVVRRAPIDEPAGAYSEARRQWSAPAFLERLLDHAPASPGRLLGVTERDLFVPVLSFVFGQAQLGGRVAVVSLARLRPEFHGLTGPASVLARRAATEAVHEVGHSLGLVHCRDRGCPMALSIDLAELDAKGAVPCAACAALCEGGPELRRARAAVEGDAR